MRSTLAISFCLIVTNNNNPKIAGSHEGLICTKVFLSLGNGVTNTINRSKSDKVHIIILSCRRGARCSSRRGYERKRHQGSIIFFRSHRPSHFGRGPKQLWCLDDKTCTGRGRSTRFQNARAPRTCRRDQSGSFTVDARSALAPADVWRGVKIFQ